MPESIKSALTTRSGEVLLLAEQAPDWWVIRSASETNTNGHKLYAAGDATYVRNKWAELAEFNASPRLASNK